MSAFWRDRKCSNYASMTYDFGRLGALKIFANKLWTHFLPLAQSIDLVDVRWNFVSQLARQPSRRDHSDGL